MATNEEIKQQYETGVREMLKPGAEQHKYALNRERVRFEKEYRKSYLETNGLDSDPAKLATLTPEQRKALDDNTKVALQEFDVEVLKRISAGAVEGARPSALNKKLKEKEDKAHEGISGVLHKLIDWVTGGMGFLLDLVKQFIPAVGNLIEGTVDSITGNTPTPKDTQVAGAILKLQDEPIMVRGQSFSFDDKALGVIQNDLKNMNPAARSATPPASTPPSIPPGTVSPTVGPSTGTAPSGVPPAGGPGATPLPRPPVAPGTPAPSGP